MTEYRITEAKESLVPEYHVVDLDTSFEEAEFMAEELSRSSGHECYVEGYCVEHGWHRQWDGYCEDCASEAGGGCIQVSRIEKQAFEQALATFGIGTEEALAMATQRDSVYAIPSIVDPAEIW